MGCTIASAREYPPRDAVRLSLAGGHAAKNLKNEKIQPSTVEHGDGGYGRSCIRPPQRLPEQTTDVSYQPASHCCGGREEGLLAPDCEPQGAQQPKLFVLP